MAKSDFLLSLRTARNFLAHQVRTDDPRLGADRVKSRLERADLWLSPSSVKGFDVRDFRELSPLLRAQLAEDVRSFLAVAKEVHPVGPATEEQSKDAWSAFRSILEILAPYLGTRAEEEQIRVALKGVRWPPCVLTLNVELGADSTGDPAIWIWVFVDDEAATATDFPSIAMEIEEEIRAAFAASGVDRWPYVRFRTRAEQLALR